MQTLDNIPLTIWLNGTPDVLIRKEIIRVVPGKRVVFHALWGERPVVAKIFFKMQHAQRELKGALSLQNVDVNKPGLLYRGWSSRTPCYVLIYELIDDCEDLDTAWWIADRKKRSAILKELIATLAKMHLAGLYQQDMHLKNFLWKDKKVYVIDPATIAATTNKKELSESVCLKNLAHLLAQISPEYDVVSDSWYSYYAKHRNVPYTLKGLATVKKWISHWRKLHLKNYSTKVFRNTSEIIVHKNWQRYSLCDKSHDTQAMRELLTNPDQFMNSADAVILKAGNTCTVAQVLVDGKQMVVKRYNIKNIWHALNRAWRPSRAVNSWRSAKCLASYRIPTAYPIAMLEKRLGPLRRQAYFITEYVEGENLQSLAETKKLSPENWRQIAIEFQVMFMQLAMLNMSHGDFKSSNFVIANLQPSILDLDAMRIHTKQFTWKKAAKRDYDRFMKNWTALPHLMKLFKHFIKSV